MAAACAQEAMAREMQRTELQQALEHAERLRATASQGADNSEQSDWESMVYALQLQLQELGLQAAEDMPVAAERARVDAGPPAAGPFRGPQVVVIGAAAAPKQTVKPTLYKRLKNLLGIKKQEVNVFTPPATNTQHPTTANPPQSAQRPQQNPQTAPAKPPEPTVECAICMDNVPMSSTVRVSEEPAAGPSNRPVGGCEHRYCRECMTQHVLVMVRDRKYPIGCPDPACEEMVVHDTVCALLKPHKADMEVYTRLQVEHVIGAELLYCPHKECSALLLKPEQIVPDARSVCPVCGGTFCLSCNFAGWHKGLTCAQFQELPPEQRTKDDAALFHLSNKNKWRQCPSCKNMVERSDGCNYIKCRCGKGFCFQCGVAYKSNKPTAKNNHGEPGCKCALFPVPAQLRA